MAWLGWWAVLIALVLAGCAGPPPSGPAGGASDETRPGVRKVMTAAVFSQVPFLAADLNPPDASGNDVLVALANSGFTAVNRQAQLVPRLAETIPSLENGLWQVSADGRMEMTWKLRSGVVWHDGQPFTSADAVFTATVYRDRESQQFFNPAYASVEAVEAPDPQTVVVRFGRPYIDGDKLFTWIFPEHLAARPFREDKANFTSLSLWREGFVGTGPFKMADWMLGSEVRFTSFDMYFLGRPKIDELIIKFIPDANTLLANLLSGALDANLGRGMTLEQALRLEQEWQDARVEIAAGNSIHIWPQFRYTNPVVITDARFRRAMLHAIDRQEMVETLRAGRSSIANAWIRPDDADYPMVERSIVRYAFDPRRSTQLLEELGYVRAADGMFRDASGQLLGVEIRTTIQLDAIYPVADYWKRVGVDVTPTVIPRQLAQDLEHRAHFPGFEVLRGPTNPNVITSAERKTPETRWGGANYPSYSNPDYDALSTRYYAAIGRTERMQLANDIMRWWSEHLVNLPLIYDVEPIAISNRVTALGARNASGNHAWNAHEWDLRT